MRQASTPVTRLPVRLTSPVVVMRAMPISPSMTPLHLRKVSVSLKKEKPMRAPISGVVAFRMAE
ncbi:hypothetical protein ACF2JD_00050 [Aeromonas sp. A-5]|uniref:hypothetical protein n=1 Tax=Aeromonas ichthyocola TaxID=3367746 RepID=UPI0038ED1416